MVLLCLCVLNLSHGTTEEAVDSNEFESWVEMLGAEDWRKRVEAQNKLLDSGNQAIEIISKGLNSPNPEILQRTKLLLDILDPEVISLKLTRIELDPGGTKFYQEYAELLPGEEASIQDPSNSSTGSPAQYQFSATLLPDNNVALESSLKKTGRTLNYNLSRPLKTSGTISMIDRGARTKYLQIGGYSDRQRFPFLIFLEWDRHRRSQPPQRGSRDREPEPQQAMTELLNKLQLQAQSSNIETRLHSIKMLGLLGDPKGLTILNSLPNSPETEDVSLLAKARLHSQEALSELNSRIANSSEDQELTDPDLFGPQNENQSRSISLTEASLMLLKQKSVEARDYLLMRIGNSTQQKQREIFTCFLEVLSDPSNREWLVPPLLNVLSKQNIIGQLSWSNPETEQLYLRLIHFIRFENKEEHAKVLELLNNLALETQSSQTGVSSSYQVTAFVHLWNFIANRIDLSETAENFVPSLITHLESHTQLSQIARCLAITFKEKPLPVPFLESIYSIIEQQVKEKVPGRSSVHIGLLIQLTQNLKFTREQYQRTIEFLVDLSKHTNTSYQNEFLNELQRWTGVIYKRPPQKPNQRVINNSTSYKLRHLTHSIRQWLRKPENIDEAYKAFIAYGDARKTEAAPKDLEFIEFDLLIETVEPTNPSEKEYKKITVLDGRQLLVKSGTPFNYRDRWENEVSTTIQPLSVNYGSGTRYRISSSYSIRPNIPILYQPRNRTLRTGWYESSKSRLGYYSVGSLSGTRLSSLVYIRQIEEEDEARFKGLKEPTELWSQFKKVFLEGLEDYTLSSDLSTAMRLIDTLGLEEALPAIRQLFNKKPDSNLARYLLNLGDETPITYLKNIIKTSKSTTEKDRALLTLTEFGDGEAMEQLLESLKAQAQRRTSGSIYSKLGSLEKFIDKVSYTSDEGSKALNFIIEHLHHSSFQTKGFAILKKQAGSDFGFSNSWRINGLVERRQAQAQCVEFARTWWKNQQELKNEQK